MQQKQCKELWRKGLVLLSLLALLCMSSAAAAHIHGQADGSLAQQECVLCVIGGQSPALLAHLPTAAAYLSAIVWLSHTAEQYAVAAHHHSASPRAPPVALETLA